MTRPIVLCSLLPVSLKLYPLLTRAARTDNADVGFVATQYPYYPNLKKIFPTTSLMCIIEPNDTHRRKDMRTNVVVDDILMASALKASGLKTKKDAIEEGLKLLVQMRSQKAIKNFRGKLKWSGNLDKTRTDK